MSTMQGKRYMKVLTLCAAVLTLSACKPEGPPPDLVEGQRKVMDNAKALEGQMQQQAQERMKSPEDEKN